MHLLLLLSGIVALCLTQLAAGLPQSREQAQLQQPENSNDDAARGALAIVGMGATPSLSTVWGSNKKYKEKIRKLQDGQDQHTQKLDKRAEGQREPHKQVSLGSVRVPTLKESYFQP